MNNFDWQYYLDKYPDLRMNGVHTEQQALQHWINHGEKEGRVSIRTPPLFDWQYYLEKYPDLRMNGVHTEQQTLQHWINHGEKEGRVSIRTPPLFNWQYYLEKYPDLRMNGVHTEQQALQHWFSYGEKEGRVEYNIKTSISDEFINEDYIVNWIKLNGGVLHTRKVSNINEINLSLCPENTIVGLTGYDNILEHFFTTQITLFKHKIILVTLETDRFNMKEEYIDNPLISHWFTWNKPYNHEKVTCIPIGLNYDRQQVSLSNYLKSKSSNIKEERNLLCSNFSLNVNERDNLINKVTIDWKDFCDIIQNIPFIQNNIIPSYTDGQIAVGVTNPLCYEVLSKYKFILSPRGGGVDCHRTWEALYLDIIPIVLSSSINELYEELPILVINDWNEITEDFLNQKYIEISNKKERGEYNMKKLYLRYWFSKIEGHINTSKYYSQQGEDIYTYTLVVYSHSEFSDILNIQHDYIKNINVRKILFIDKLNENYDNFNDVYIYDTNLNYSKRIFNCLNISNIDTKYILFIHDNDIILNTNHEYLLSLIAISCNKNIDRIDLKYSDMCENVKNLTFKDTTLVKNENINDYNYNVNPSLWKLDSLVKLMNEYNYSYRDIENINVQKFCLLNFNMYKIFTYFKINAGWYVTTKFFTFLHITHGGMCLPIDNKNNHLDEQIHKEYIDIINKYKFNRQFKTELF
jgi:hypothetical protein